MGRHHLQGRSRPVTRVIVILANVLLLLWSVNAWRRVDGAPPGMAAVPGGPFASRVLKTTVDLPAFYIDRDEVSNADFSDFIRASGYQANPAWKSYAQANGPDRPVVGVTFADAEAFAAFYGKRLPGAVEWERACLGDEGRDYPWGSKWTAGDANIETLAVAPSGKYPRDRSPSGARDMAGNVFEWSDSRTDDGEDYRAVMGSAWLFWPRPGYLLFGLKVDTSSHVTGFRCAWPPRG